MQPVFVSYSRDDKEVAHRIVSDLKQRGVQLWIDEAEIQVGDSVLAKVEDGPETIE